MSSSVSYRLSRINSILGIIKLIGLLKVSNKTINAIIEIIKTKITFKKLNFLFSKCLYECFLLFFLKASESLKILILLFSLIIGSIFLILISWQQN